MKICSLVAPLAAWLLFASSAVCGGEVDRPDYKFTAPDDSKVSDEEVLANKTRETDVDLPNGNAVLILALSDKAAVDKEMAQVVARFKKGKLTNTKETASKLFDKQGGKGRLVTGKFVGMDFCVEVGSIVGKKKAFVFICTYLAEEKKENDAFVHKILDSFMIKE